MTCVKVRVEPVTREWNVAQSGCFRRYDGIWTDKPGFLGQIGWMKIVSAKRRRLEYPWRDQLPEHARHNQVRLPALENFAKNFGFHFAAEQINALFAGQRFGFELIASALVFGQVVPQAFAAEDQRSSVKQLVGRNADHSDIVARREVTQNGVARGTRTKHHHTHTSSRRVAALACDESAPTRIPHVQQLRWDRCCIAFWSHSNSC
mmetsp:Transcript_1780/g.2978  ORF Transcript_1780/g.2978 Transcript_1780/m.2978 type:complete len:206 (-) Transcript_1780:19-636(-)